MMPLSVFGQYIPNHNLDHLHLYLVVFEQLCIYYHSFRIVDLLRESLLQIHIHLESKFA